MRVRVRERAKDYTMLYEKSVENEQCERRNAYYSSLRAVLLTYFSCFYLYSTIFLTLYNNNNK